MGQDFRTSREIGWIQLGSNPREPHADVAALDKQPRARNEDGDDFSVGVTANQRSKAVVVVKVNPTAAVFQRKRMVIEVGHQGQEFQSIDEAGVAKKV